MNYTYIFIMILVLIMINGLLFRMKNNRIIKTIESFETNIDGVEKIYKSAAKEILNGYYTSSESNLIGKTITNSLMFDMINDNKGKMRFQGKNYKVEVSSNNTVTTNIVRGTQYKFNINPDIDSYRLPITNLPSNIPVIEMIDLADEDVPRNLIFKFSDDKLDETIMSLIRNKNTIYNPLTPNTDGNLYSSESISKIKKYKFNKDALVPEYISIKDLMKKYGYNPSFIKIVKNKIDYIKERYDNTATFQIKRNFAFANDQEQSTPMSNLYNFKIYKGGSNISDGEILIKIKHKAIKRELAQNKLLGKFYDITTYPYFHKVKNSTKNYNFSKPNLIFTKDELQLKNKMSNYFDNYLYAPDLNSATKIVTSDFNAILLGNINTYDKDNFNKGINTDTLFSINY
jgi:hypothetical protein